MCPNVIAITIYEVRQLDKLRSFTRTVPKGIPNYRVATDVKL